MLHKESLIPLKVQNAGGDKFYAPVVNASSGYTLVQDKGSSYVSRAAVGK